MRIAIACSSLCCSLGGSERAATNLAGEMAARGHQVSLLSLSYPGYGTTPLYPLPRGIFHLTCNSQGKYTELRHTRELLTWGQTDVFLSMQSGCEHLYWAMICMGSGIPFICSERCDPVLYTEQRVWNRAGRLAVLSGADIIHELLPAYVESIPEYFRQKVRVIPNAAPTVFTPADPAGEIGQRKTLLFLARFDEQKRPLLLLEAFRLLMDRHPEWDLVLRGHGPQEKRLRRKIRALGTGDRIRLPGVCRDAPAAYADAHIYCLPSSYEGFPNSLLEAMCAGLPCVGFRECAGSRDVLHHGETGILVDEATPEALARALDPLMADAARRTALGQAAKAATAEYAPRKIYDQWEALFAELAAQKGQTVMDAFAEEPFASQARLSSVARREWLARDFGMPMPWSSGWLAGRGMNLCRNLARLVGRRIREGAQNLLPPGKAK